MCDISDLVMINKRVGCIKRVGIGLVRHWVFGDDPGNIRDTKGLSQFCRTTSSSRPAFCLPRSVVYCERINNVFAIWKLLGTAVLLIVSVEIFRMPDNEECIRFVVSGRTGFVTSRFFLFNEGESVYC